jgi:WD40 repeat protein
VVIWSLVNNNNNGSGNTSNATVVSPEPYRVLLGHTGDVIDVSWSQSYFVLSASVDKTVRLWHLTRSDCLQFFRHPDIVTCVEFHPVLDRFFVSGCFDKR